MFVGHVGDQEEIDLVRGQAGGVDSLVGGFHSQIVKGFI